MLYRWKFNNLLDRPCVKKSSKRNASWLTSKSKRSALTRQNNRPVSSTTARRQSSSTYIKSFKTNLYKANMYISIYHWCRTNNKFMKGKVSNGYMSNTQSQETKNLTKQNMFLFHLRQEQNLRKYKRHKKFLTLDKMPIWGNCMYFYRRV